MTKTLKIARGLEFPIDAVTQTFGLVGRRGSGKTNAAGAIAEEMLGIGAQMIILDPIATGGACGSRRTESRLAFRSLCSVASEATSRSSPALAA